jgi:transaldolase
MEFFLDTADINQIKKFLPYGIIDGITTNPSLLAGQSDKSFAEIISNLCKSVLGPISVEVSASDYSNMLIQGNKILDISQNIILKLPITWDGIRACNYFASNGYKVNMTLCFSVTQALMAAKVGAYCVSPFIGRIDDIGHDGLNILAEIHQVFKNYPKIKTKILAASVRNITHVYMAAKIGVDIVTMSADVMSKLINNPLTQIGLEQFEKDWQKSKLEI